jgi:hypothetical protein
MGADSMAGYRCVRPGAAILRRHEDVSLMICCPIHRSALPVHRGYAPIVERNSKPCVFIEAPRDTTWRETPLGGTFFSIF